MGRRRKKHKETMLHAVKHKRRIQLHAEPMNERRAQFGPLCTEELEDIKKAIQHTWKPRRRRT